MNKQQVSIVIVFLGAAFYTSLAAYTSKITPNGNRCESETIRWLAPFSSGCFYSLLYHSESKITPEKIMRESRILEAFVAKGGKNQEILWYRLQFYQTFRIPLEMNYQQLHGYYQDYLFSEHSRLDRQLDYLNYLKQNSLFKLAQITVTNFCKVYIPKNRGDLVAELGWRLTANDISLSLTSCIEKLGPDGVKVYEEALNKNL